MEKVYYQVVSAHSEFTAFTVKKGSLLETEEGFNELIGRFENYSKLLSVGDSRKEEAMNRFIRNMAIALVVEEN